MEGEAYLDGGTGLRPLRTLLGYKGSGAGPGARGRQGGASRAPQHAPERLLAILGRRRITFEATRRILPDPQTSRAGGAWARRMTSPRTADVRLYCSVPRPPSRCSPTSTR